MPKLLNDDYLSYSPFPPSSILEKWLEESNQITRQILINLQEGEERVPCLPILNPPLWEFGHLSWFHEFWVHRDGQINQASFMTNADYLFNSSEIAHQDRWSISMPSLDDLLEYNQSVIDRTKQLLCQPVDAKTAYFIQLAIFHQDMHNEAFAYMWQTMAYSMPFLPFSKLDSVQTGKQHFLHFPKSTIQVGSDRGTGFIFDNEKWGHTLELPAFDISSTPVTNADYLEFLESKTNLSETNPVSVPNHWKKQGGIWLERFFQEWLPLNPASAVRHINYLDAQRFCSALKVRLPSEHELGLLISQKQQHWQPSHLWEWTSSPFAPFPEFRADPYSDYSQPWFDGSYQVLKGGGLFTPDRLKRVAFRNFYQRDRSDHFCGFRTCLL